jgi:hypothetical protein
VQLSQNPLIVVQSQLISMNAQSSSPESSHNDDGPFLLHPTPQRPLCQSSSVTSRQKLNLKDIDQGICFITGENLPTKAIQDAHIMRRKIPVAQVSTICLLCRHIDHVGIRLSVTSAGGDYPRGNSMLIVTSTESTVSSFQMLLSTRLMEVVRADIHIAYDHDLWVFVPERKMLVVIEESLTSGKSKIS